LLDYLEANAWIRAEPAVLLIHGNLAGKSWWRELLEEPAPGYRLLARRQADRL
jgi:pimeloyl-ACP methyl ester carboxylesterase